MDYIVTGRVILVGLVAGSIATILGLYIMLVMLRLSKYFRGRLLRLSWVVLVLGAALMLIDGLTFLAIYALPEKYSTIRLIHQPLLILTTLVFAAFVVKIQTYTSGLPSEAVRKADVRVFLGSPVRMFLEISRYMDRTTALNLARRIGVEYARINREALELGPEGLARVVKTLGRQLGGKMYIESGYGVGDLVFEADMDAVSEERVQLLVELLRGFWEEAVSLSHKLIIRPKTSVLAAPGTVKIIVSGQA